MMKKAIAQLVDEDTTPAMRESINKHLSITLDHISFIQRDLVQHLNEEVENKSRQVEKPNITREGDYAVPPRMYEPLNLEKIINDAIRLTSTRRARNKVNTTFDISMPGRIEISGNRSSMLYLFVNLITNAHKAIAASAQSSEGLIKINAEQKRLADTHIVMISICDNGCGIPLEKLNRIFTKDYPAKKQKPGFGLHWCAKALQSVNGKIYATSAGEGRGACFNMIIPIKPRPENIDDQ
jgi:signal transduction histidine kinase